MKMKSFMKISAAALIAASVFATTVYAAAAPPDVAGKPYEAAVSALSGLDIITGDVDGLFYPDSNLTRAQFCTIVVKAMRAPAATVSGTASQNVKRSGFPDLSGYGWADGYIAYAVDKGVVTGYPDGSFKPGSNVTVSELITMTLRAAGYSDASLGGVWPENYITKASDIGALAGLAAPLPEYATKWMAAQLVYNVLTRIEAANPPEPENPEGDTIPSEVPSSAVLTYAAGGAFDVDITMFAGKSFTNDVKVLRYGLKAEYSKDMTLSENKADYLEDTIYKYKSVETPAWYELKGDKISRIILPRDVGFTGRAYGVLQNTVRVTDSKGGEVDGFVTLTAGRAITWAGNSGLTGGIPSKSDYNNGQLVEFQLRNGEVTAIAAVDNTFGAPNSNAVELGADPTGTPTFAAIKSKMGNVITLDVGNGAVVESTATAVVYVVNDRGEYSIGSMSSVREKALVRLYDVSNDKVDAADAVIVKEG
jgi:hypothetical protein